MTVERSKKNYFTLRVLRTSTQTTHSHCRMIFLLVSYIIIIIIGLDVELLELRSLFGMVEANHNKKTRK